MMMVAALLKVAANALRVLLESVSVPPVWVRVPLAFRVILESVLLLESATAPLTLSVPLLKPEFDRFKPPTSKTLLTSETMKLLMAAVSLAPGTAAVEVVVSVQLEAMFQLPLLPSVQLRVSARA